jgi:transposase
MQITTIGLDIAKNVFQVHGIDAAEKVVIRKQLRRGQVMKFFEALLAWSAVSGAPGMRAGQHSPLSWRTSFRAW